MTSLKLILEVVRRNQGGRPVQSVIVEMVANAVNIPGLLEEHDQMMRRLGFMRSANPHNGPEILDPANAGFVQPRKRLALVYDLSDMVTQLGHAPPIHVVAVTRETIRDILDPVDNVPRGIDVRPHTIEVLTPVLKKRGPAGAAVLTFGGEGQPVEVGSKVRLASTSGTWRVMSIDEVGNLHLLDTDRGAAVRWTVEGPDKVLEHIGERKTALSLDGQLRTAVARLGEPP